MLRTFTSLLVGGLALLPVAAAGVIEDFERDDAGIPGSPAVTVSLAADPEGSATGKALSLAWPLPHKAWVECAYLQPRPIAGLNAEASVAIRAQVWIPALPSVTQFAVRLVDARHEMFQWSTKVAASPVAGWQTLTIPIDLEKPAGHWGGNNDGRLDFPLRLGGYALVFANDKVSAGRVLLDQVQLVAIPKATLQTDRFPFLVNATGDARCELIVSNPEDHPVEVMMKGTLAGFYAPCGEVSGAVVVPAGGSGKIPLALGDRKPGIRWLDYSLQFGSMVTSGKATFIIADPVPRSGKPDDFLFSICSHTERCPANEHELEMQAAAAAGATVMRIGVSWATLEPKPGEWKWDLQDRLVELATRYGIETQPILGYGPSHATSEALRASQADAYRRKQADAWAITLFGAPEEAPWRRYVAEMAKRYRGKIRLYEVWNEPDLGFWRGTTDEYVRLLRAAHEELRRADPKALLLTGGFATLLEHPGRNKNPNLQERVLAEASDAFDVHAFHQHGTFGEFKRVVEGELRRVRSSMQQSRPLYFNETAISSAYIGEKMQAVTLVKKMAYAMAQDAIGYTWYDLRNDGTNPTNMEHNYGLLTMGFHPKAAYAAYGELARRLHGMRHVGDLDLGSDRQAHVFGSPRGRTMVWWNEGGNTSDIPVMLRCGNGVVRSADIMGVSCEVPQVNGVVLVQPTDQPQYLEMPPGEGLPTVLGSLVQLRLPPEAAPSQPLQAMAELTNPFAQEIKVRLSWRNAAGEDTSTVVSVPAAGHLQTPLEYRAPAASAISHPIGLHFSVVALPWSGVMRYTLPVVRALGEAGPAGREPDWVLNRSQDVVNFCQADPSLAALTWRGADDLSARIWAWQQDGKLRLRVDVRDDVHVQKENPAASWKGDGVQLALLSPGGRGAWEIGVAQGDDGRVMRAVWVMPPGVQGAEEFFTATCEPIAGGLRYEIALPRESFGLAGPESFRFNLIVNDNDGNLREGFVRIAPGLGESKDTNAFPTMTFHKLAK